MRATCGKSRSYIVHNAQILKDNLAIGSKQESILRLDREPNENCVPLNGP